MLSTLQKFLSLWAGKVLNSWLPTDNLGSYYKALGHSKQCRFQNFGNGLTLFLMSWISQNLCHKDPFTDVKCSPSFGWKSWLKVTVCIWGSGQLVLQPFVGSVPHSLQCRHWRAVPLHGYGIRILVRRNSCSAFEVNINNVTLQIVSVALGVSLSHIREYLTLLQHSQTYILNHKVFYLHAYCECL